MGDPGILPGAPQGCSRSTSGPRTSWATRAVGVQWEHKVGAVACDGPRRCARLFVRAIREGNLNLKKSLRHAQMVQGRELTIYVTPRPHLGIGVSVRPTLRWRRTPTR